MGYTMPIRHRENGQHTRILLTREVSSGRVPDRLQEIKVLLRITSHRDCFMEEAIKFQLHPDTSIGSGQQSILELRNSNKKQLAYSVQVKQYGF